MTKFVWCACCQAKSNRFFTWIYNVYVCMTACCVIDNSNCSNLKIRISDHIPFVRFHLSFGQAQTFTLHLHFRLFFFKAIIILFFWKSFNFYYYYPQLIEKKIIRKIEWIDRPTTWENVRGIKELSAISIRYARERENRPLYSLFVEQKKTN